MDATSLCDNPFFLLRCHTGVRWKWTHTQFPLACGRFQGQRDDGKETGRAGRRASHSVKVHECDTPFQKLASRWIYAFPARQVLLGARADGGEVSTG